MEKERLNKYLAACGICSRRDADKMIDDGRVRVNGHIAAMGERVSVQDHIEVNGNQVASKNQKVVFAYYKPVGVVCTERDKHADKKITDMVKFPVRVTYAGRLDKDSEGLLILTNDGDLINSMMRGSAGHEKEYVVKVNKEITEDFLKAMSEGVYLKELDLTTRSCQIEQLGKYTFRIILTQGVNRQIRRMAEAIGFHVTSIKRIRVVNLELANLKPGEFKQISGKELQVLYNKCGLNTGI